MSAPYTVLRPFGESETFLALESAIRRSQQLGGDRIIGGDYDCDCDEIGFFECNDGLTEEERDLIEMAGLGEEA